MPGKVKMAKIVLQVMGWLAIVSAAAILLVAIFGSVIIGVSAEETPLLGSAVVGVTGFIIAVITLAFGVLYLITARGIADKKNWAKVVGIILAILSLPGFPIGTILGVMILIGLLSTEGQQWFQPAA